MSHQKKYLWAIFPPVAALGANIRSIRRRHGLKAKDLAAKLGVAPPVLSAWENDRGGMPETPTLLRLAKALECSVDELLRGVDADYDRDNVARSNALNEKMAELRQLLPAPGRDGLPGTILEEMDRDRRERVILLAIEIGTLAPMTTHLWPGVGGSGTPNSDEPHDLVRHDDRRSSSAADSQPQREVTDGVLVESSGAAASRVQQVDPAIVSALENVALLVGEALQAAKGQPVHREDAKPGKAQPRLRAGRGRNR